MHAHYAIRKQSTAESQGLRHKPLSLTSLPFFNISALYLNHTYSKVHRLTLSYGAHLALI